ncbi:Cullin family-domain-containing protein [Chlamydoabsidia padenii]|nr:Cullin family-domain-containing protein [Chlamydoabsidia padenii]
MKLPLSWIISTSAKTSSHSSSLPIPSTQTPVQLANNATNSEYIHTNNTKDLLQILINQLDSTIQPVTPSPGASPSTILSSPTPTKSLHQRQHQQQQGLPKSTVMVHGMPTNQNSKHTNTHDHIEPHSSAKRPRLMGNGDVTEFENMTLDDDPEATMNGDRNINDTLQHGDYEAGGMSFHLQTISGPVKTLLPRTSIKSDVPTIPLVSKKGFTGIKAPSINSTIPNYIELFTSFIDSSFVNPNILVSQQVLYEMCSFVCQAGEAETIFGLVSQSLHSNAQKLCDKLASMASTNVNFLEELVSQWKNYRAIVMNLNQTLEEINHHHMIKKTKFASLTHFGQHLYWDKISQNSKIKKRTISNIIYLISCQRCKLPVESSLIITTLRLIYENLPTFRTSLDQELVESTQKFYNERARIGVSSYTMPSYVTYAINLILSEPTSTNEYRRHIPQSITPGYSIAIDELLIKQLDEIFREGMKPFLVPERRILLEALYRLFAKVNATSILQTTFGQYIKDECQSISKNVKNKGKGNPSLMIATGLIELKKTINSILSLCFDSNPGYAHVLKESFEIAINKDASESARHIAHYFDWHLEHLDSQPLDEPLDNSPNIEALEHGIDLFRSLQAEDVFKCQYKSDLSRRLLKDQTWKTIRGESYMVDRLQSECGTRFSSDLVNMINDIRNSLTQSESYKAHLDDNGIKSHVDLHVNIISGETWSINPFYQEPKLSTEMLAHQQRYIEFYKEAQPRRKLTWMPSYGTCLLEASYPNCTVELNTTQYQAMILLLFNNTNILSLTVDDIVRQSKINRDEVVKALDQLSKPETMILIKQDSTMTESFSSYNNANAAGTDAYSYNSEYNTIQSSIDIQQTTTELSTTGFKNIVRRELFSKKEKIQALIMKNLKKHRKLPTEELHHLIALRNTNGYSNFFIDTSIMQTELNLLVKRGLIRKMDDGLWAYCDE